MGETTYVFLDLETRSHVDIKKSGGHVYVRDESTELLCGVAMVVTGTTARMVLWSPHACVGDIGPRWHVARAHIQKLDFDPEDFVWPLPDEDGWEAIMDLAHREDVVFVAHNAEGFDRPFLEARGFPTDVTWLDTMHRARQSGLPAGLDEIGRVLFDLQKDRKGQQVLYLSMKPHHKTGKFIDPDAARLGLIARYCARDVLLMAAAFYWERWDRTHPDDATRDVHCKIDHRGVPVDTELAERIYAESVAVKDAAVAEAEKHGVDLTTLRSSVGLPRWLATQGVEVDNVQKGTVERLLRKELSGPVRAVLEARLALNRVTEGKALAVLRKTCPDGRMRGALVYWGAHTGRWAGRGLQPQNLPAPVKDFSEAHYELDTATVARDLKVEGADVLGSMLRGIIVAEPGKKIAQVDYSQIEARVLLWLARDEEGLNVFREGKDVYRATAAGIYGVPYDDITKGSVERTVGKVATLALGYQGGSGAFSQYAEGMGINLEKLGVEAQEVVDQWRDSRPLVAGTRKGVWQTPEGKKVITRTGGLWKDYKQAALRVITRIRKEVEVGRCTFRMEGPHLYVTLPSGRPLVYRGARYEEVEDNWGGRSKAITFLGVGRNGKAERTTTYGGKLAENCLAGDTLVATNRGWVMINSVTTQDLVWDGIGWVSHKGLVRQGWKETYSWLGIRATGNHLILVGSEWKPLTQLGESASGIALKLGRDLAPLWSKEKTEGLHGGLGSGATAGPKSLSAKDLSAEVKRPGAGSVETQLAGVRGEPRASSLGSSSEAISACGKFGSADTLEWSAAATIPTMQHIETTEVGGFESTQSGWLTEEVSSPTCPPYPGGTKMGSTSTGLTTKGTTNLGTFGSSPGGSTATTDGTASAMNTQVKCGPIGTSAKPSARSGALTRQGGISAKDEPRRKWSPVTCGHEEVFDLLDCGPRSRFMVLTEEGPVLVHNCTQAVARDILAGALVRLEAAGLPCLLTIHDEVLASVDSEQDLDRVVKIMTSTPDWARGLPVEAAGEVTGRYGK